MSNAMDASVRKGNNLLIRAVEDGTVTAENGSRQCKLSRLEEGADEDCCSFFACERKDY